jgi:hypothetical protein
MGAAVKREEMLQRLDDGTVWDMIVVGGATGLGTAVEAASRGYRTASAMKPSLKRYECIRLMEL